MIPAIFVTFTAALLLYWLLANAGNSADNVSNTLPNPNYPPPPSLGGFGDAAIDMLFNAIKLAENSDPKYNNPLDLAIPNWQGPKFGEGISVFSNSQEGINRGKFQLYLIGSGQSKEFSLDWNIPQMATKWTKTNADGWAQTVMQSIGITSDVTLRQLFTGTAS